MTVLVVACGFARPTVVALLLNAETDCTDSLLDGMADDPGQGEISKAVSRMLCVARQQRSRLLAGLVRQRVKAVSSVARAAQVETARVMRRLPLGVFRDVASLLFSELD